MDCIACHDSHGSYDAVTNPGGNPYMLRDYVEGSQFLDDSARPWQATRILQIGIRVQMARLLLPIRLLKILARNWATNSALNAILTGWPRIAGTPMTVTVA